VVTRFSPPQHLAWKCSVAVLVRHGRALQGERKRPDDSHTDGSRALRTLPETATTTLEYSHSRSVAASCIKTSELSLSTCVSLSQKCVVECSKTVRRGVGSNPNGQLWLRCLSVTAVVTRPPRSR
jgi:hypothetical protein